MNPFEMIEAKRQHLARLTNQRGASGEVSVLLEMEHWVTRPRGIGLKVLLAALAESGVVIKGSSFDAIALPDGESVDFTDPIAVQTMLPKITFIEIKTANQERVREGFTGFFFALTEAEIAASEALVLLCHKSKRKFTELQCGQCPSALARAMLKRSRSVVIESGT